jgi:hypothetical protein
MAEEGETADLVKACAGSVSVLPDDQHGIERAIETLLARQHAAPLPVSPELFDGELRTRELVAVLESMIDQPSAVGKPYGARAESPEVRS